MSNDAEKEYITLPNGQKVELSLDNPLFSDFERMPATFDRFISDPYYLGKSWKNPWPFWKEQGEKMFPLPLRSPYNSLVLLGATGIGKALKNGTGVLTPTGYIPIEKLNIGDLVASNDGNYYHVQGVFPQGKKDCYEIEFGNSVRIIASGNHIWTISRDGGKTYHDETTDDILLTGAEGIIVPPVQQIEGADQLVQDEISKLDLAHRTMTDIEYVGKLECTCIKVDAPNHLFLTEHCIPTHNTTFAVNMVLAYYLHIVLCLRNPQEYFALEEQKKIVFAFINIVTKTIAYQNAWGMLHTALLKSPFFMEYGYATEGKRPEWVCDKKPIALVYGSTADHIIGLDILACLTGDTVIRTSKGLEKLENLVNKEIQVPTYNIETHKQEMSNVCRVLQTKFATTLYEIELENGSILRCTPEHRFLLITGEYKRADELTLSDELSEGAII